jgi:hypothetical protein
VSTTPNFLVNIRLLESYPQVKMCPQRAVFSPVSGLQKGRIRGLVTPDLSRLTEDAVVRA